MLLKIGSPLQWCGWPAFWILVSAWAFQADPTPTVAAALDAPPGVVLAYRPASSSVYLGSQNLALLPNGHLVASFQDYGVGAAGKQHTYFYRSEDRGATWTLGHIFEQTIYGRLFVHRGKLYYMGTRLPQRQVVLMRSDDNGLTWTQPLDATSGVILAREGWNLHTVSSPVIERNGRLWMAIGDNNGPTGPVGRNSRLILLSAPSNKDLLNASNWQYSEPLASEASWLAAGRFDGWQEGNAVFTADGKPAILARLLEPRLGKQAALVTYDVKGEKGAFDPEQDIVNLPGGGLKCSVRYDAKTKRYWALTNHYFEKDRAVAQTADRTLNMVALVYSDNLRDWTVKRVLLFTEKIKSEGFLDMDWTFDGDDIVALTGTAWADSKGGAEGPHRANFTTFHRFKDFRH